MSHFVYGANWSYRDYLQAASFEDSVNGQISRSSREIVATHEQLQNEHIGLTREIAGTVETISWQLGDIRTGIAELTATCEWGFSGIVASLGLINNQLYDIKWQGEHQSYLLANEQFQDAKRNFERGWHQQAFTSITRAIEGEKGILLGYPTDFRYHYLLGAIRLGDFKNQDTTVLDLTAAEKAFLDSAKFSRPDQPHEAARALVLASWSAYCLGSMKSAERHAREAILLNKASCAAYFQLAKILMHEGRPDEALPFLEYAIRLDRNYSLTVLMDQDFTKYPSRIDQLLKKLRAEAKGQAEQKISVTRRLVQELEAIEVSGHGVPQLGYEQWNPAKEHWQHAEHQIAAGTYFGFLDGASYSESSDALLNCAALQFVERVSEMLNKKLQECQSAQRHMWGFEIGNAIVAIPIVAVVLFALFFMAMYFVAPNTRVDIGGMAQFAFGAAILIVLGVMLYPGIAAGKRATSIGEDAARLKAARQRVQELFTRGPAATK